MCERERERERMGVTVIDHMCSFVCLNERGCAMSRERVGNSNVKILRRERE